MKVSRSPSDYFPSSVKKLLESGDYEKAAANLRGVAGEMIFVIDEHELPGGLKIVSRQVDAGGKKIDFGVQDAAGNPAKLEVKAWNQKRWQRELDLNQSAKVAMSRPVLKLGGGRGGDHYAAFARAARGTSASRRLESAASQSLATAPRSSRTCPATGRSRPLAGHAEP